jgi:hypothetical protein
MKNGTIVSVIICYDFSVIICYDFSVIICYDFSVIICYDFSVIICYDIYDNDFDMFFVLWWKCSCMIYTNFNIVVYLWLLDANIGTPL